MILILWVVLFKIIFISLLILWIIRDLMEVHLLLMNFDEIIIEKTNNLSQFKGTWNIVEGSKTENRLFIILL